MALPGESGTITAPAETGSLRITRAVPAISSPLDAVCRPGSYHRA